MSPFIDEGVPSQTPQSSPRWHVNVPGFLGLFAGLALIGLGAYLLFVATTYVGAFLFILSTGLGVSVIGITRDFVENRRHQVFTLARMPRDGFPTVVASRYVRNERTVEDREDKKLVSGKED